jgi:hypothetical protein
MGSDSWQSLGNRQNFPESPSTAQPVDFNSIDSEECCERMAANADEMRKGGCERIYIRAIAASSALPQIGRPTFKRPQKNTA